MTQDAFHNVNADKFREMLSDRFGVSMSLALADTEGRFLECDEQMPRSQEPLISEVIRRNAGTAHDKALQFITDDQSLLLIRQVEAGGSVVVLAMLNRFTTSGELTYCNVITHSIEVAFESIVESLLLNYELNDMADDLSARYEELNLFYGLDDIVESQDASRGRSALKKLVENCSQYLSTDVVSITVHNAGIDVESHALCARDFLTAWEEYRAKLTDVLGVRLNAWSRPVVFNDVAEISKLTDEKLEAKIAMTPIHSVGGELLGFLTMARTSGGNDFSNSDRRLLRVVAEQASTIVSASFDVLTGLLNRDGLAGSIRRALHQNKKDGEAAYLILVDLNQFRIINDTCGRIAGDELIRRVGNQLRNTNRSSNQIARLEADKFALLVSEKDGEDVWKIAGEVSRNLSEGGFYWENRTFDISAAIGIVKLDDETNDADEAFALAAISCEVAKQRGRGEIFLYNANSTAVESARGGIDWIPQIRSALENDAFELFGQQIVPLQEDVQDAVHFEILLRLRGEDGSVGSPFQMIKAAEDYKIVSRIDEWVISRTLTALKKCKSRYPDINVSCSVNMSGQSVTEEFFQWLRGSLQASPELIPCINIEITETNVVSNLTTAIRLIESLRSIGVKFSLDDFGTGMSSFGYLRDLPVDYLKIDGSFVKHIVEDPISHAMVESIHRVSHLMGLKTVAEFVENDLITGKLRKIGIDYGQGYGLNKPAPLFEQLDRFYEARKAQELTPVAATKGS